MEILKKLDEIDFAKVGQDLHAFATELFPICRSITGNGIRQTLAMIQKQIPLQMSEVPSGTAVFDWTVPKEWNIRDAYIRIPGRERVVDFQKSNLHVVNYSKPVQATFSLSGSNRGYSRSRTARTGFLTVPPTTRKIGASACRTISCWPSRTAATKCASTPHWRAAT